MMMLLCFLFCVVQAANNVWTANTNNQLFFSQNDATSFITQNYLISQQINALFATSQTQIWGVGNSGTLITSSNAGSTWSNITLGTTSNLLTMYWIGETHGWLAGTSYMAYTNNSGVTWYPNTGLFANSISFFDTSNGYFTFNTAVFRTTNGGVTWGAVALPATNTYHGAALFAANSAIIAGQITTSNQGILYRTTNGGASFTNPTIGTFTAPQQVLFISATEGFLVTTVQVFRTDDAGLTWTLLTVPGNNYRSIVFSGSTGWIAGSAIFSSTDSTTWIEVSDPGSSTQFTTVTATNTNVAPATVYQVTKFYSGMLSCGAIPTAVLISQPQTCIPATCANVNGLYGAETTCETSATYPFGWTAVEIWQTSTSCQGSSSILALPNGVCAGFWQFVTIQLNCASSTFFDCGASQSNCTACASQAAVKSGQCVTGNPSTSITIQSYKWYCPATASTLMYSTLFMMLTVVVSLLF